MEHYAGIDVSLELFKRLHRRAIAFQNRVIRRAR